MKEIQVQLINRNEKYPKSRLIQLPEEQVSY